MRRRPHRRHHGFRQALESFFAIEGWPYAPTDVAEVLQTRYGGRTTDWVCLAEIREPGHQLVFHSLVPERGPADRFPEICEYITRANFGLAIGNFELDMHDGEIRYKTSIDVEGATITPAMVKQIVHANVIVTGLYLPGLLAVISGELSATEAIGLAEPPG